MDIEEYVRIDKRIDVAEEQVTDSIRESLRDRWEFGKLMLAERKGKQLPKGRMAELVEATGKSETELSFRARFAARYSTEDEVCTAIQTFTSWAQLKKSLPKPRENDAKPPPKPHPQHDTIIDLHEQGATGQQIAETIGINPRTVDRVVREERIEQRAVAEAAPIDWTTIPGNQREKLDRAKVSIRKELEKGFRTRFLAEADQYRAQCDANVAAYKAKLDAQAERERARRDQERRFYDESVKAFRAKGLITPDEYNVIRSCLHPDSRASVSDEKLATAFRLFNDSKIKTLLVKEI
jgi:hypothetical protein